MMSKTKLLIPLAGVVFALGGCAMMERDTTTTAEQSPTTRMGGSASPFTRTSLDAFSLSNCLKFDALPYECERTVTRGQ
jgi:hypothetical protein